MRDRVLVGAEGRLLAQSVSSARSVWRDENRRIADAQGRMSVHRRIADLIPSHGEGQLMTLTGLCTQSVIGPLPTQG